jgi:hypothetical protein
LIWSFFALCMICFTLMHICGSVFGECDCDE